MSAQMRPNHEYADEIRKIWFMVSIRTSDKRKRPNIRGRVALNQTASHGTSLAVIPRTSFIGFTTKDKKMNNALKGPILGVLIAIAVNAGMDAIGLSDLSFASLFPLMLVFWAVQRLLRKSMGFFTRKLASLWLGLVTPCVGDRNDCTRLFNVRRGGCFKGKLADGQK